MSSDKIENKKSRICFISLGSSFILTEKYMIGAGGAEIQQVKLSKELKKRGYEISFIIYGENHLNMSLINGMKILSAYTINNAKIYSFFKKALCIYRKMKEADSDIYFYRAGAPGISSIFCKLNKKILIKSIASDAEATGEQLIKKNCFMNYLSKIANLLDIKLSDKVISQSEFQKSKLKERFNIDSIIIKSLVDISINFDKKSFCDYLLWVGTIKSIKQPELFLKIAQYFPEYKFIMIGGGIESSEFFKKIKNAAKNIQNVEFKGFVSPQEIYKYYQKAILLINTSRIEGFPNIFLEAWSFSVPVVSLNVNPDGIISKYKLGFHSKTFEQMLEDIKTLLKNKELLEMMGKNGKKYVEENHNIMKIADQYEILIENLLKNNRRNL